MSYGLGYDSDEGRALAGAITAIMTGHAYEQSAPHGEGRWGRSPATRTRAAAASRNRRQRQRRLDARSHRAAPRRTSTKIQASERFGYLKDEAQQVLGQRARARQEARLPQRAGHRARADRHDRLPHGLRHHRHRARHRAGEIQAARRRRHAEDRQPDRQARAAEPRLRRRARSRRSSRTSTSTTPSRTCDGRADRRRRSSSPGLKPEHLPSSTAPSSRTTANAPCTTAATSA